MLRKQNFLRSVSCRQKESEYAAVEPITWRRWMEEILATANVGEVCPKAHQSGKSYCISTSSCLLFPVHRRNMFQKEEDECCLSTSSCLLCPLRRVNNLQATKEDLGLVKLIPSLLKAAKNCLNAVLSSPGRHSM